MTPPGMAPQGRLGVHRRLPRWHALRKEGSPNVGRRESSGAPDDNLPVNLMPLEYCTGPEAKLAAYFRGDGDLALGGKSGICGCHGVHITRVMNCWSSTISSVLSQKGLPQGRG